MSQLIKPRQRRLVVPPVGMRGLTHWWSLNDAAGGRSNPLAGPISATNTSIKIGNGPPFATPNSGALFNTSTSKIVLDSSPILPTILNQPQPAFTISFWVYLTSLSATDASGPRFIGFNAATGDNNSLNIASGVGDGSLAFTVVIGGTSTITGTTPASTLAINKWYHVILTYDGAGTGAVLADYILYLNGVLTSISSGTNLSTSPNVFGIGCRGDASSRILQGNMADIRYCKGTVWTAAEVAQLYYSAFIPNIAPIYVGQSIADVLMSQIWL